MGMDVLSALGLTLHPASHTVFSLDEQTPASEEQLHLPAIDGYAHRIQLKPDAVPKAFKLRRLPLSVREEVSAELNRLLRADVIERADASQWVSSLTVTRKKDGRLRICTDLRLPNSQIIAEVHPLPTIDDLERNLRCNIYSRIDLESAYFQLCLQEDSRDITAFLTMDGLFRWKRVPMGLISAGSAFQKLLDQLLSGIAGCGHYLDDILVSGRSQSEHDARLQAVLARHNGTGPATLPVGTAGPVTPLPSQPPAPRPPTPPLNRSPAPPPETAPPSTGRTTPSRPRPVTAGADGADRAAPDSGLAEHELPASSFGRRRFVPVKLR